MLSAEDILNQALTRKELIKESFLQGNSEIQKFYRNTVVFITGATGFVGKHLVEKLLRSCEVKKIYVMLRSKKSISPQKRVENMLKEVLYDDIRAKEPNFEEKIRVIAGDIGEVGLGIKEDDWRSITKEVDVIIHSAAMVKFDAPIVEAVLSNVRGTREVLKLGQSCKKLSSFVHVSTAYTHATKSRINKDVFESFYQPPIPPDVMIKLAEEVDRTHLRAIEEKLMEGWPNIYTFTKSIAEELVRLTTNFPACIARPSTVLCSYTEPYPGWVDKIAIYGATGLVCDFTIGVTHAVKARNDVCIDYVPVDFVNNAIIASAWETAKRFKEEKTDIKIYNVCSGNYRRPWGDLSHTLYVEALPYTSPKSLWYQFCFNIQNEWLYFAITFMYHIIPAYLVDLWSILRGKNPRMVKHYEKVTKVTNFLKHFTLNEWNFKITNLERLYHGMSKSDQIMFCFDMSMINWKEFILLWVIGIRKYILEDGLEESDTYIIKQKIKKYLTYLITFAYLLLFLQSFYFLFWGLCLIFYI